MDECKSFKKEYDKCFNTWFRDKFLKGSNDDSMCSELLKHYTGCVKKAMKDKDIDIRELRRYHTEIGSKDE
ncbi:TP53-regulated inhibitor of apoptosis 1-B-like [Sipha flava]|uniref:TP53-regulated inhibitor of apoptosis 1-B-like n=1 Tax=Sipha flava TaxID=143950 RepID=A0A8B8FVA9_9HEMI|nr:TP53-regulated inhibitor of apoptosis 1-B-like [Sipha flava]